MFISNNISTDTIKKNDITTVAVCTDNNVDVISAELFTTDVLYTNNGNSLYYYINSITNSNNQSSVITNSINLHMSYLMSYVNNTLIKIYDLVRIPNTKDVGLVGIDNKGYFNIYLYQTINKLGRT
jgi:hypothetical protein